MDVVGSILLTALVWYLENLSLPLSIVAVAAMAVTWPRPKGTVRGRISTYFFLRHLRAEELRSRDVHGSGQTPDNISPSESGDRAGVECGGPGARAAAAPPAPSAPAGAVPPSRACRARPLTSATRYVQVADVRTPAPVGTRRTSVTESACPPASTSAGTGRMPPAFPVPAGLGRKVTDG